LVDIAFVDEFAPFLHCAVDEECIACVQEACYAFFPDGAAVCLLLLGWEREGRD
jgi:hypothetical protein